MMLLLLLQKHILSPIEEYDDDGEPVYDSCRVLDFNYSSYSQEELLNWDRSVMVTNTTTDYKCNSWVYDQSVMKTSMVVEVCLLRYCCTNITCFIIS